MSTDLQFCRDFPKIRLSPIQILKKQQCSNTTEEDTIGSKVQEKDNESCTTPKSEENKIPAILCCPPAPRKPKRRTVSCKRKLADEMQFFEILNGEEVDSFFRSSFELQDMKRRNCT
ncbi:cyclin-dependent protein kinase inhibitor SMR1-like [Melia azedarach]|uniref:Cyclin-dependent protein kinase inhibitor SMR1-like n=1 Tax=Melia azedarach TaxID=155640 RepID=A0ACC1YB57_MELAZ|nr:cyclin-dependent protein kinase inhibitor SMR1-like [Melia azedarach]